MSVAVSFSTQRNAEMLSFEPSRIPAWLAPVCDERVRLPLRQLVRLGQPTRHRGCVPISNGSAQHRESQPVDLEEDDSRPVGSLRATLPACDPLNHLDRVRVVVVRAEDHLEHDADRRDDQCREQGPAEVVDVVGVVDEVAAHLQHQRVEHEHEDETERDGEGESQRGEEGREDRVQRGDDERHEE